MVTVPYGQQVLYAHAGTIRSGTTEVILSGQTWGMPPQFPGPVTLYLERTAGTPADTVNDCVVRVLPRGAGGLLPEGAGPALKTLSISRADVPAPVLGAGVLQVTDSALTALATPTGLLVWATRMDGGQVLPRARLQAEAFLMDGGGTAGTVRRLPSVTTNAQGLALLPHRERLRLLGSSRLGGVVHHTVFNVGLWPGKYGTRSGACPDSDRQTRLPSGRNSTWSGGRPAAPTGPLPFQRAVTVRLPRTLRGGGDGTPDPDDGPSPGHAHSAAGRGGGPGHTPVAAGDWTEHDPGLARHP